MTYRDYLQKEYERLIAKNTKFADSEARRYKVAKKIKRKQIHDTSGFFML